MANAKNLASGKLAESISASTTNILVYVGDGSASTIEGVFPTAPFYITAMPANPSATVANSLDSEIMLITAVGHDQVGNVALTATRAQRGTTAKAFNSGSIITLGIYSEDTVFMSEDGTSETPTPWINASDIIWSSMINKIYPIGSIFMSATLSTASAVGNALGGTWVAWGSGRVPVGVDTEQTEFDTVEETGGEKTHTLSVKEIPRHRHYAGVRWSTEAGAGFLYGSNGTGGGGNYDNTTGFAGNGEDHNNLQPYITCYMYKRTA